MDHVSHFLPSPSSVWMRVTENSLRQLRTHWKTENLLGQLRRFSSCFTLRDRNVGTRDAAISYVALDMSLSHYPTLRISTIPQTHFKGPSFSSLSKSLCKVEDGPHICFHAVSNWWTWLFSQSCKFYILQRLRDLLGQEPIGLEYHEKLCHLNSFDLAGSLHSDGPLHTEPINEKHR